MKIKLAILDSDRSYISRITSAFQSKYAGSDQVEIYAFTDEDKALSAIKPSKINVLLASDAFKIDPKLIPNNCGFAYLVETRDIEQYDGRRAVFKFQKIELLYNAIVDLFADSVADEMIVGGGRSATPLYLLTSASGGVGASTLAAATAKSLILRGKTPLYINFEHFGNADLYFSGEGQANFGDVIYAMKSHKPNFALKLATSAKRDASGVYYYSANANALDTKEISGEEIAMLIDSLKHTNFCDCVVIDINLSIDDKVFVLFKLASKIIFISDGSDVSNIKLSRAYNALRILENNNDQEVLHKAALFFSKFSNKIGSRPDIPLHNIGGVPRFEHMTTDRIIQKLVAENTAAPIVDYLTGGRQ
jgi:MinD-like ATPase involved in chromosome partitioning or flagellar assembly